MPKTVAKPRAATYQGVGRRRVGDNQDHQQRHTDCEAPFVSRYLGSRELRAAHPDTIPSADPVGPATIAYCLSTRSTRLIPLPPCATVWRSDSGAPSE